MYDSWASRIRIFIEWKNHGRIMLDSIDNGPLVYPNIKENGHTRPKKYSELTEAQKLQDECDVQVTNIILYGLPPDVYALVNHQEAAKDIWDISHSSTSSRKTILEFAGTRIVTTSMGNYAAGQPRVVKCYKFQGEGHMERQYPGISKALVSKQTIPQNSAFQTKDLDAYNSDCDDLSSAKAILMENLSSYDPDVVSEVPYYDSYPNDMINQDAQEMHYSEQTHIDDFQDNEIHSDSNIILYSQYLQESQDTGIQDTNSSAPNDLLFLSLVKEMTDHVANLDKSGENSDLNAQLQENVFAITTLKNKLRKLKGKNVIDIVVSKPSVTIALGMFKLDIEPISHRLKNNRDAHEVYLEKTIENTDTLHGLVKCARKQNHSETLLESACMFTKNIQELKPGLSYLYVFGALCYPTNHGEDLVIAPEPVVSTSTPSSTIIKQDAPSSSTSQTTQETPSPVIPLGVEEADHDIEVAHMDNNPFVEFSIPKPSSEELST
nr:hypothetical protein [Tanacetum cinerariifolium]